MFYTHTYLLSFRRSYYLFGVEYASPICVLERVTGAGPVPTVWKTAILLLYDTRKLITFFRFLHIYYIRIFKKSQIFYIQGTSYGFEPF